MHRGLYIYTSVYRQRKQESVQDRVTQPRQDELKGGWSSTSTSKKKSGNDIISTFSLLLEHFLECS